MRKKTLYDPGSSQIATTYLSVLMVDHNVMRLHIAVHDALAVAEVQRLEELEDVVPHVDVVELGVQRAEVRVVDVLEDKRRGFALCRGKVRLIAVLAAAATAAAAACQPLVVRQGRRVRAVGGGRKRRPGC